MDIASVEIKGDGIEITYSDGSREEIENGVYQARNASRVTTVERAATAEDLSRLSGLAGSFEAGLAAIDADIAKVERGPNGLEITYADGAKEEIEGGKYERSASGDADVLERPATAEDLARLEAAADAFVAAGGVEQSGGGEGRHAHRHGGHDEDEHGQGGGRHDGEHAQRGAHHSGGADDDAREAMFGGADDDRIRAGGGAERIHSRDGDDDVRAGDGDDLVAAGDGDDRVRGGGGDDDLRGEDGDDRMRGGSGDDILDGGAGRDRLNGDRGADIVDGGDGNDRVRGAAGDDEVHGGGGDDRVRGDSGDDIVDGGGGRDRVRGGAGDDMLDGGDGSDRYHGGRGADVFVFAVDGARDKIHDFQDGVDVIDIAAFGLTGIDDVLGAARQDGEDVVLDLGGGDLIKIDDFQVAQLTADDFLF